jgi:hypothetical protein
MLATIGIDAQRDHDAALGDLHAVDEYGHQIELAQIPSEQFGQLLLGAVDEALRDGRLGGGSRINFANRFQAGTIPAR